MFRQLFRPYDKKAKYDEKWYCIFNLMKKYKRQNGNCSVPYRYVENGINLGQWAGYQRMLKRKKSLLKHREDALRKIDFPWYVDNPKAANAGKDALWKRMFNLMKKYKSENGNCNVPTNHVENGRRLGRWASRQRFFKNANSLRKDREYALQEIGFQWESYRRNALPHMPCEIKWYGWLNLLKKYKSLHGNCEVPFTHVENGRKLGLWASRQRALKNTNSLQKNREDALQEIGFQWEGSSCNAPANISYEMKWNGWLNLLKKYKSVHGNCEVPFNHFEDGRNLGLWASRQRALKKANLLRKDREDDLKKIGFQWERDRNSTPWEDWFNLLNSYKNTHGHCNVPRKHIENGRKLGLWLKNQRAQQRRNALLEGREYLLNKLGVVWI
eukprot:CAMPEP_0178927378 /NCGR_PEP_ID=MMETSP0786-20121207/19152_1 /TAXON_ID=186022 /ORGANISM="Thalassionema frauenfeldii, Strain CCMP 1798" /LENGTH=384 /DNA_ID=CAMNT_0020602799 /DNA_START=88 /DNA_END=1242 /DNA_ORIENTATION=+